MTAPDLTRQTLLRCLQPGWLAVVLGCFFLPFMTLTVEGCDGGGAKLHAHRTVTGVDLAMGRAEAPSVTGEIDAGVMLDATVRRGQHLAISTVVITLLALACSLAGPRAGRATLWLASLSSAALFLLPGSLSGGWRGPPVSGNQLFERIRAEPQSGWVVAAVASLIAVTVIAWLLARLTPARLTPSPTPPARMRAMAAVIDLTVVSLLAGGPAVAIYHGPVSDAGTAYLLAWIAVGAVYWTLMEGLSGHATVGKRQCRLYVTGPDGEDVGLRRAFFRFAARILWGVAFVALFEFDSFSWPGFCLWIIAGLLALFGPGRLAPHDLLARTSVSMVDA